MRIVIIEDEKPAAEKLQDDLKGINPKIEVLVILHSVRKAVEWLQTHENPDLIFMDIELTDGSSLRIFEQAAISCPVIFITAYDEYWQAAFENNSIDYLLKPVKLQKLEAALRKYDKLKQHFSGNFRQLLEQPVPESGGYKKRFLAKRGIDYISIRTEDISCFHATHKLVCLVEKNGQKFILDQSLSDIEKQLDPAIFYRVNRKYLVNINAIKRMRTISKSKLLLDIEPQPEEEIIISQDNVTAFKEWIGK
jgi:two-component system LytT family response regulator